MIKIFEKSPLELLCYPLMIIPMIRKSWTVATPGAPGGLKVAPRQMFVYEHIWTVPMIMFFVHWMPFSIKIWIYAVACTWHVILKECLYDPLIAKKPWSWNGIIERLYSCALGLVGLI